jgi:hypothetical protein
MDKEELDQSLQRADRRFFGFAALLCALLIGIIVGLAPSGLGALFDRANAGQGLAGWAQAIGTIAAVWASGWYASREVRRQATVAMDLAKINYEVSIDLMRDVARILDETYSAIPEAVVGFWYNLSDLKDFCLYLETKRPHEMAKFYLAELAKGTYIKFPNKHAARDVQKMRNIALQANAILWLIHASAFANPVRLTSDIWNRLEEVKGMAAARVSLARDKLGPLDRPLG